MGQGQWVGHVTIAVVLEKKKSKTVLVVLGKNKWQKYGVIQSKYGTTK